MKPYQRANISIAILNYPLLLLSALLLSGSSSSYFLHFTAEQDIHTRSTLNCYYHMILAMALLAVLFLNS